MKCEVRKIENITLFSIQGDFVFNDLNNIRWIIKGEMTQSSNNKFLIDLEGVGMIDSAGVGFIVSVYRTALARRGTFALIRPKDTVKGVLQTVGLTRLFNIYESEDEAIKSI